MMVDQGIASIIVAVIAGIFSVVVGVKLRATNKRVTGISNDVEAELYKTLSKKLTDDLERLTSDWKIAEDSRDRVIVENVWLRERLMKTQRDLAHFDRRKVPRAEDEDKSR